MKIYRYPLDITDYQTVAMPLGYRILSVAPGRTRNHLNEPTVDMWAQVPEVAPSVGAHIYIVGAGNPMPKILSQDARFIGTAVMGALVWHVFEARP